MRIYLYVYYIHMMKQRVWSLVFWSSAILCRHCCANITCMPACQRMTCSMCQELLPLADSLALFVVEFDFLSVPEMLSSKRSSFHENAFSTFCFLHLLTDLLYFTLLLTLLTFCTYYWKSRSFEQMVVVALEGWRMQRSLSLVPTLPDKQIRSLDRALYIAFCIALCAAL